MISKVSLRAVLLPLFSILCSMGHADDRKTEYAEAVAQGAGALPWIELQPSPEETQFRAAVEQRKTEMLSAAGTLQHPALVDAVQLEQLRHNIETTAWAKNWYASHKSIADYLIAQPEDYVDAMISPLTPGTGYGFTCPHCVGTKSQESEGDGLIKWDYKQPDQFSCWKCGQVYPSPDYPETYTLQAPRMGQAFSFYINPAQQAAPDNLTGDLAYKFVGHPQLISFTGYTRYAKNYFMIQGLKPLAYAYQITGDPRYARLAVRILDRLAVCYRQWLYHDIWMSWADCDPLYATWNDQNLKLEWKRNPFTSTYKKDTPQRAAMTDSYFCAGRYMPSTDNIALLVDISLAYDLIYDAKDENGQSLWTAETRARVERDLLLEWVIGGEPFVGGRGKAEETNNKAPRVYSAQAAVARALGIAELADVALRGYEVVRDHSLLYDGFSDETPAYTNMYLYDLLPIPELLNGFVWPAGFAGRSGTLAPYSSDWKLRQMYRTYIDQLRPDAFYLPFGDSEPTASPVQHIVEIGLKRYPEYYRGKFPTLMHGNPPGAYAAHLLSNDDITLDTGLDLPEIYFPGWMTAILRHGEGPQASLLSLTFPPKGGHRHADRLSLYYSDRGQTLLGDLGYINDSPMNSWFGATASHNLVVVDEKNQTSGRDSSTLGTRLLRMAVTPKISVVEGAAGVYRQCSQYRRLNALIKGPEGATFGVDIFRVSGGDHHAFRIFSELASSEAGTSGSLTIDSVTMPEEPPLPNFGMSMRREDIFGLRDTRLSSGAIPPVWHATWSEPGRAYRLWMLTQVDQIALSNGPGQEVRSQAGRRVRVLDAIREGWDFDSTFVALHEPSVPDGGWVINAAQRLTVPESAGKNAVALSVDTVWGNYLVFSEFENEATLEGVRFQGHFGVYHRQPGDTWLMASGATTFSVPGLGFENQTPRWSGKPTSNTQTLLHTATARPADWSPTPEDCLSYTLIDDGEFKTGFPVKTLAEQSIEIDRFPLQKVATFDLPRLDFIVEKP